MHSNAQQIDNLQVIPQLRSFLRSEVSTATQRRGREETQSAQRKRREGNGEKKDQLEAALSFFFFPQGIRLHQHAESQLIPSYIKPLIQTTRSANTVFLRRQQKKGAYTFALKCGTCVVNKTGALQFAPTKRKRNPYEMRNRHATETN